MRLTLRVVLESLHNKWQKAHHRSSPLPISGHHSPISAVILLSKTAPHSTPFIPPFTVSENVDRRFEFALNSVLINHFRGEDP
ncbi:hypothetical protein V6N13_000715 [Hibiscus sabdariffa]|uniref:Uncharacterized protein n=1 Tax=Hibiscus sabdariffa TaxID=183260 RepID=A0ABR2G6W5_9ROSI